MNCWKSTSAQLDRLVEMAMQDRQGEHAVLGVAEEATDARRADLAGLEVEQARDHLQVVLHPMMDLAQHMVALFEAGPQLRLAAGDRLGHRLDALAHRRQLGRPRRAGGRARCPRRGRPGRRSSGCSAAAARTSDRRPARPPAARRRAPARPAANPPQHRPAPASRRLTPAAVTTKMDVAGQRQQVEFVERAVLAVVAKRRLAADDGRGKPGGDRQRAGRQRVAADRAAVAIDQRHRDVLGRSHGRHEIADSRERNSDGAHAAERAVLQERAAPPVSPCAAPPGSRPARRCANALVSRTRRKISRSEKLTPTAVGRLAQRATPSASVTRADEYSSGNFSRTLVR